MRSEALLYSHLTPRSASGRMTKLKRGRSLELLVSHLEKVLGHDTGVKVESPKRLPDLLSDRHRPREHDVVLTVSHGHHKLTIALECRDHSRPIGVSQVEAFSTKCRHTGVDQGVLVSSQGFYKSALEKADKLSIRCLSLEQVTSFGWLLAPGIHLRRRRPKRLSVVAVSEGAELQVSGKNLHLVDSQGTRVPPEGLLGEILSAFERVPWDAAADSGTSELTAEPHGLLVFDPSSGRKTSITRLDCKLQYDTTAQLLPFELVSYIDRRSGELITEAALANVETKSIKGRVMIIYNEGEGGGVYFVKEPQSKTLAPNPADRAGGKRRRRSSA